MVIGVSELPKKFRHVDDEEEHFTASIREELEERAAIGGAMQPALSATATLPPEGLDLKEYLATWSRA